MIAAPIEGIVVILPPAEETVSYAKLTLAELARRIASQGDAEALHELHQRTPFYLNGNSPIGVVGLIDHLRRQVLEQGNPNADRAYDLTMDKFSCLAGKEARAAGRKGTDCRRYFEAYATHLNNSRKEWEHKTELEREMFQAKALQSLVRRHYGLALRECQRASHMTRFVWHLPNGALPVLMPRSISGRARRRWLEANIPDADPGKPDEQLRVQAIIDDTIGQPRFSPFVPGLPVDTDASFLAPVPIPGEDVFRVSVEGLADCVAREKATRIAEQRPAIQAMGPAKLQEMIRSIFDGLAESGYSLAAVAVQYGVSKPTLSRFAGIRWHSATSADSWVPDLWRNTAKVIGSDPEFVEAAQRAGVWRQIEEAAELTMASTSPVTDL